MKIFPAKILVVDESPKHIVTVRELFAKEGCSVLGAENEDAAMAIAGALNIDLILLDATAKSIDGYGICKRLKSEAKTQEIPVIFTGMIPGAQEIKRSFEAGGADCIVKPFNHSELYARVRTHLELRKHRERHAEETEEDLIYTLAYVGELRSQDKGHLKRVAGYSALLGELYGLRPEAVEMLKMASAMHDIGNVIVPERILNKPLPLEAKEREAVEHHTQWGAHILSRTKRPVLRAAAIIAAQHHEKFDGSGYPKGLKGEDIHIFGRIVAVADVFDVLLSKRSYKEEWQVNKALAYLTEESGKHFDPKLVELFVDNLWQFLDIRQKHGA
ncbi:response regulator [Sulfurimonas sp. HSL-3221]|uniref:response regulator n=1 Tax=Sulfurimonadaceae TaxID=2771471 RepID=UPI001E5F4C16|nr:HD domain-containing phosphohydrolase [Sulfurimonas sp. HSL-3221]UFS62044.1 response regulator [Sulfurimonas sp. HSL-3221]